MRSTTRQRLTMTVVSVGLLLLSNRAFADEPPATTMSPPTDAAMVEGRKHFVAGVNLLEDPDGARYEEAYHAFQKAYALTRSPKVLGNIGLCSMKLERDGEAIDAFTGYLRESPDIDPSERAQIERDLATLSSTVGTLRVVVSSGPGNYVLSDTRSQSRGAPVLNTYSFQGSEVTVRLRPGQHSLKVKTEGAESIAWELSVQAGTRASRELKVVPTAEAAPASPSPAAAKSAAGPSYFGPVVLGVLGLTGLGVGVVSGVLSRSKEQDIVDHCPKAVCPRDFDLRSARTDAKTYATVADVSMIGGGAVLAGAIVWALVTPGRAKTPRTGSITWSPSCSSRDCRLQLGGSF